ncbi:MAG: Ger(x)C family spore germination protein [Ignavibacteriaceae bacterium]|nr:Ger(x)C family spore germination protein [Ignavibacteriaceae bacterium]
MKLKRILSLLIVFIMLTFCLSGCWNSRELNTLAFVTAMGFDRTSNGMQLTIQVLNPRTIASQKSYNEPSVVVYTEEGKDTLEIIRRLSTESPRKLNGTHLRTVIFGEDFAKDGISDVLDFFSREHQNRTDLYFAVAKGITAYEVLNTLTDLETNPSFKLYSSIKASDEIWAGTESVKIISLINSIVSDGIDPVLTGIEIVNSDEENKTMEMLELIASDPIKIGYLAVFQNDKFVGWLDENECKGYNFLIQNVKSSVGYVESERTGRITIEVTDVKSKRTVLLINGEPVVSVIIDIKGNIDTVAGDFDITKAENIRLIEQLSEDKITKMCYKSINKAQKELNSDIFGFGEVIHRTYPKLWSTMKDDWNYNFKILPVNVKVNFKIDQIGIISKSFFAKES